MILEYAESGNFNNYLDKNYERNILFTKEIKEIHHCYDDEEIINEYCYSAYISDMGLCKKIDDIDKTSIHRVMSYVIPEVLRRKPYTQAANIYSFDLK
ncbi:hypothetical protein RclHR1_08970005 [Rhizophagus clarus]|uniref:Protein kinase domain-containing protein n=1 Tax=Rhizophagus clarus TaxID=94130 RepID=A0A2Z6SDC3_9GLOM|nr:hypothetical protein RclHR1_08970005 [Rhizophagus clarus]